MKRILGSTLALTVLLAVGSSACDQPKINCTTGHGGFAMKYTLKAGSMTGTGMCDARKGEIVGLEKYNPQKLDDLTHQDLNKAILAIRTSKLGQLAADGANAVDPKGLSAPVVDSDHDVNSVGDFAAAYPDDNGVCVVPTLSPAEQSVPAFNTPPPASKPMDPQVMHPATDIKYEWKNVRVYATPDLPGTQMVGEVTYTENGCSATYSVLGLYPAVSCEAKDAMGNGTGMPDPTLCDPVANPDAGRATGSGINPDLKARVGCDPDLLLCILTAPPSQLL